MTSLGLGVLAVVAAVVLVGVLAAGFRSRNLIEAQGVAPLVWAALLFLPCRLLAGAFTYPVRLLLRLMAVSDQARRAAWR